MGRGLVIYIKGKPVRIEYSRGKTHILGLWDRPFKAIQNGEKRYELRTNTAHSPFDFNIIQKGDIIKFVNETTGETLAAQVKSVRKFATSRDCFEEIGLAHSSSKPKTIEEAINNLESHTGYKEGIKKHGLFAFEIEL